MWTFWPRCDEGSLESGLRGNEELEWLIVAHSYQALTRLSCLSTVYLSVDDCPLWRAAHQGSTCFIGGWTQGHQWISGKPADTRRPSPEFALRPPTTTLRRRRASPTRQNLLDITMTRWPFWYHHPRS